jgi:pyruvate formate lyase activating enzyme
VAFTYTEPTIWFEFVRDVSLIVRKEGIKTILVTNGYSSKETNQEYVKFIDAANIDFKAFNSTFYPKVCSVPNMQPILDTAKFFHDNGIHIEITNLIIPDYNDDIRDIEAMCIWIAENLSPLVPLHFSAYHPSYKMTANKTPMAKLFEAYDKAIENGLKFVYLGNIIAEKGNNTKCPNCGAILISRSGYSTKVNGIERDGTCKKCSFQTKVIF